MIEAHALGPEAIDYIRESLSQGNTLAQHVSSCLQLELGSVVALLPMGTVPDAAIRFAEGGVARASHTEAAIVSEVAGYLRGGGDRLAVFEDVLATPSDSALSGRGLATFWHGGEVYYLVGVGENEDRIRRTIRFAASHVMLGVLTRIAAAGPRANEEVSESVLLRLAENAERLLVGAYDGESVLIWSRGTS